MLEPVADEETKGKPVADTEAPALLLVKEAYVFVGSELTPVDVVETGTLTLVLGEEADTLVEAAFELVDVLDVEKAAPIVCSEDRLVLVLLVVDCT